jgi:hypothetical protein
VVRIEPPSIPTPALASVQNLEIRHAADAATAFPTARGR